MAGIGTLTKQAALQLKRHANKMKTQVAHDRFANTPVSIFSNPTFYRTYRADVTKSPALVSYPHTHLLIGQGSSGCLLANDMNASYVCSTAGAVDDGGI